MSAEKKVETSKPKINRRQFLGIVWGASVLALTGEALGMLGRYIQPVSTSGFGGVVRAGKVDDFKPGSVTHIQAGRFFLVRLDDGSFIALWQKCTHLGCSVPWVEAENQFHCPCHGSLYNKLGEVQGGPAPRPFDIFPVTIQGGEVFVDTGKPITRKSFDPSQTTKV